MKNGIVIPCYNEADRLKLDLYQEFLNTHEDFKLCFVNDGSRDRTLDKLLAFQEINARKVEVVDMPQNAGKAEAVRSGINYLLGIPGIKNVGFIDADLSTGFEDYKKLVASLNGSKRLVFGSRKMKGDSHVERSAFRSFASEAVGLMIRSVLALPIRDTQCGAKVFTAEFARHCFKTAFQTRWLFDVELFIRAKKFYGRKQVMKKIREVPLKEWVHVDGSKISLMDSVKIPAQLLKIVMNYKVNPLFMLAGRQINTLSYKLAMGLNLL